MDHKELAKKSKTTQKLAKHAMELAMTKKWKDFRTAG